MDEGEPPLSKIVRRNPHNAPILVQYGHTLKETGRLGQAETAYRKAIAWGAGVSDNYVQLGHVLKLEGKLDDARTATWSPSCWIRQGSMQRVSWMSSAGRPKR